MLQLVSNNRPKQHVRAVITLMSAAMRRAGSRTVQSMLLTLPWWPRKSSRDVWPMAVVVDNCVLAKVLHGYEVTEGSITVTLERWLTKRDDPPTKRVANILLFAAMEPTATEALKTYIRKIKPQPLHQVSRPTPRLASLASLSALQAGPRVTPTPGQLAGRRADPRRPGAPFDATPTRLRSWVAIGSNPPTHHLSRMPPLPVGGSSLTASRGASGVSGSGASTGSRTNMVGDSAEEFDAQSVQAALLAARRVIDSCAPIRSPEREPRSGEAAEPAAPLAVRTYRTRASSSTHSSATQATAAAAVRSTETPTASARPQASAHLPATVTLPSTRASVSAAARAPSEPTPSRLAAPRPALRPPSPSHQVASRRAAALPAPTPPSLSPPAASPLAVARPAPTPPSTSLPAASLPAVARTAPTPLSPSLPEASAPAVARPAPTPPSPSLPAACPPAAARAVPASCCPSLPATAPPGADQPGFSAFGSQRASPSHSASRRVLSRPTGAASHRLGAARIQSLPPDTPPDTPLTGESAGTSPGRLSSSRRTVSWSDAGGAPNPDGLAGDSALSRVEGADKVAQLGGVAGSTVGPSRATDAARRLEQDSLGQRARL